MSRPDQQRSFDLPGKLLGRLAPMHPRAAFRVASTVGALRNALTQRWPAADELQSLFPHLDARAARRIAREIGALNERNRVLVRSLMRAGLAHIRPLVKTADSLRRLQGPHILGTFHVGALHALGAALEQLTEPVLALRQGALYEPGPRLKIVSTEGNERQRAALLHQALTHLRAGGIVVLALDDVPGQGVDTECLGRPLRLAPGAFALSRWSGAPIVPTIASWKGSGIVAECAAPIFSPDDAARWLNDYLTASPSELSLGLVRKLLGVS